MSLNHLLNKDDPFVIENLKTSDTATVQLKGEVEIGGTCFPNGQGTVGQILTVSSTGDCGAWEDPIEQLPKTNLPGKVLTSTVQSGEPVWADLDVSAVQNITATPNITNITGQTNTDNLQFKAQDSSTINLNPADRGNAGYFLATDGLGDTYWQPDGAGAAGITQTAVPAPTTALNKVALYNSNDGLTVKDSNLQYTGLGWNFSGERISNIQSVQTSQLSTIFPATAVEVTSDIELTGSNKRILAVENISGQNEINKLDLANGTLTNQNNVSVNSKNGSVSLQVDDIDKIVVEELETNINNKLVCDEIDGNTSGNLNVGSFTLEQGTIFSNNDNYLRLNPSSVALKSDGTIDINPVTQTNIRVNNDSKVEITSTATTVKNTLKADTIQGELLPNTLNIGELLVENTSIFSDPDNYLRLNAGSVALASDGGIDINPDTQTIIRVAGVPKLSIGATQTQSAQLINMNGNKIMALGLPTGSADAVSKGYIDSEKGAVSGICPLDSGVSPKIPSQYLPDLAITQVYVVPDNAGRDAIALVQQGDVAIVSNPANNWIWTGPEGAPTASGSPPDYDWVKLVVPTGTVTSVNTFTGTVVLGTDDVSESGLTNFYYTPTKEGEVLKKDGSVSMTGNLDVGSNKIINVSTATLDTDATNKLYVDTQDDLKLDKTGGTITGTLLVNDTLTLNNNLDANGQNIDNAFSVDTQSLINSNNPAGIVVGSNLLLQGNNILDCNTLNNGGGDLTLQSVSNTVQVVAGSKINLNCVNNVEIPNCNLDMLSNNINNAFVVDTQILTNTNNTEISVNNNLLMNVGNNIGMNGNNITNAGDMACDTLSSATATSINVNHDLVMAGGKFIYTDGILGPTGGTSQIFVGGDLVMGTKKIIAGINTLDSTGLSSTGIMTVSSVGNLTLKTNSGGDVNIEPVQRCNITAPNNLWVNGIQQDTNKSAWASMLRPDYSVLDIASGTFPLLPYTGTLPNGAAAVKNMTADPANMVVTSQIGGYYKFDACFECNTDANAGSVLMLIYINGIPFFQTESFVMKSVWSTHSITYIDRVDRPPGTTYGVRCQAVNGDIQVRQASFNLVRLTDNN